MKVTRNHLKYWQERQPLPSWVSRIEYKERPVNIHALINSQADIKVTSEPHNTLSILKSYRKRTGTVVRALVDMTLEPGCIHGARRSAYCRKWLRRILKEKNDHEKL